LVSVALPKISIKTEINAQTSPAFLGRVTVDEIRPGKFVETTPYQWVIAVKPFKFPVKGNGFLSYVGIKPKNLQGEISDNSSLGMHMAAFKTYFPEVDANIGEGEYIGKVAWFQKSTYSYPPNKNGEVFKTELLVPVRSATDEELDDLGEEPASPRSASLTDVQVEIILAALEGKKQSQFQKAIFATKAPELIQAVVSGAALTYLEEHELARLNEDGVLVRAL
jgi:hypothetical protein